MTDHRTGRVDYTGAAATFRQRRTLPVQVLRSWDEAIGALSLPRPRSVLDVGAGTGGFLDALARWFAAPITAIEPSAPMRAEAVASQQAASGRYVAGVAEHLPIRSARADLAWLSTVVHQFEDPVVAAAELGRVLRPGGRALVRGFFSDVPVTGALAHFPGHARAAATFPSTDEAIGWFANQGFVVEHVRDVDEPWTFGVETWPERVRALRAVDSALRPLTDEEIDQGIAAVLAAPRADGARIDSTSTLRLLVLRKMSGWERFG